MKVCVNVPPAIRAGARRACCVLTGIAVGTFVATLARSATQAQYRRSGMFDGTLRMLDSIGLVIMGKIENIERQIEALSPEELAQLRAWFLEFDWAAWDRQLEADIQAGKLDRHVQEARRDHPADKTTPL